MVVLILFGVKIHIDSQYNNESIFEEFYEQRKEDIGDLNKLNISSSGMKILDAKEAYIQESKSTLLERSHTIGHYLRFTDESAGKVNEVIYRSLMMQDRKKD